MLFKKKLSGNDCKNGDCKPPVPRDMRRSGLSRRSRLLLTRKLVAYGLIALIVIAVATWTWHRQRRARLLRERRHGPRVD